MEGKTNPFEDVGIRLVSGLHSLQSSLPPLPDHYNNLLVDLDVPNKAIQAQELMKRGFVNSSEGIWGAMKWATSTRGGEETNSGTTTTQKKKIENDNTTTSKEGGGGGGGSNNLVNGLGGLWGKARNSTLFSSSSSPILPLPTSTSLSPSSTNPPQSQSQPLSNSNPPTTTTTTTTPTPTVIKRPPSPTLSIVSTTSSNK